jgi:condensin complex subunit 2
LNVHELGPSVIFTGGERTLEKDSRNIDIVRFDIEAEIDPLFRKKIASFD